MRRKKLEEPTQEENAGEHPTCYVCSSLSRTFTHLMFVPFIQVNLLATMWIRYRW